MHMKLYKNFYQEIIPVLGSCPPEPAPELTVGTVGTFRSFGKFYWEQVSPGISVHIITGGSGIFETGGRRYKASKGSLFFFWPGMHIRYWDFPGTPWRYTWIVLDGRESSWVFRESGLSRNDPLITAQDIPALIRFVDELVWIFREGRYSRIYPFQSALGLIDLLSRKATGSSVYPSTVESLGLRVKKMIDSNHLAFPTIEELADLLKADRTTLYKAFRACTGMSIKEYIDTARLEKACRLLSVPDTRVKETAFACGYRDARYFSRVFHKRFGCPPSKWREEFLNKWADDRF